MGKLDQPSAVSRTVRLGIRTNLAQFSLLVGVNALVGGMVGQERTLLPLIARRIFHLQAFTAVLTFLVAFQSGLRRRSLRGHRTAPQRTRLRTLCAPL